MRRQRTAANPTSLLQPRDAQYVPAAYQGKTMTEDVAQAKSLLTADGYSFAANGDLMGKDGKQVSFDLDTVTGKSRLVEPRVQTPRRPEHADRLHTRTALYRRPYGFVDDAYERHRHRRLEFTLKGVRGVAGHH